MSVINKALSDLASAEQKRTLHDKSTQSQSTQSEHKEALLASSARLKPAQIKKHKPSYTFLIGSMIAAGCFALGGWTAGYVFFAPDSAAEIPSSVTSVSASKNVAPQVNPVAKNPETIESVVDSNSPVVASPTHKQVTAIETAIYEEPPALGKAKQPEVVSTIPSEAVNKPFTPTFDPKLKKELPANDEVVVTKVEKSTPFIEVPVKPANLVKPYKAPPQESKPESFDSQMVVKTVNLSLPQLAEHSIQSAKDALESNDSARAIQAYYSALSYTPNNESVRQHLAALLYGRKQPQKALRVLQQGIELNKNSELLRITLSKLLVREQQPEAALAVLEYIPETASSEYIAMRGALSQQQIHSNLATESYLMLVAQEPNNGRWWLGLAISYDQDSKPSEALKAYKKALVRVGVSASSQQFVRQRIKALSAMGETVHAN